MDLLVDGSYRQRIRQRLDKYPAGVRIDGGGWRVLGVWCWKWALGDNPPAGERAIGADLIRVSPLLPLAILKTRH